jgi:predicted N-acetyltransferase YhbS
MHLPPIRPMTPADVPAVAAAIERADWGDRRRELEFVTRHHGTYPLVADVDGAPVGTGIATINGTVAWVGTIWVDPAWRRRGVGIAMTQAVIDLAQSAGCRTFLLVATEAGRPLYERLGFEVQTWYRTLEAPGLGDAPVDPRIRPYRSTDLPEIAELARAASGEDRTHLLAAFASPETATCLVRADGTMGGFVVRAPWGGGSTVAPRLEEAEAIVHSRRVGRSRDERVRAGLLAENEAGLERLLATGWSDAWRAPRLIRGEPLDWQPDAIWGQFSGALG